MSAPAWIPTSAPTHRTYNMLKLLVYRATPLLLRPAVILLEGATLRDGYILVLVLPLATMALTITSVPVHLEYFRAPDNHPHRAQMAAKYISAVTMVTLLAVAGLVLALPFLPLGLDVLLVAAICLVFVSEKLADETSRALEFRKNFRGWFLIQLFRSGWLFIPILAVVADQSYRIAFLVTALCATLVLLKSFTRVTGLTPRIGRAGLRPILENLIFLAGTFLPAAYRQGPRVMVAKLFPEYAHLFLALAQLSQGVTLVYNVRFQVPYRKLIARRTTLFQRRLRPVTRALLFVCGAIALAYLLVPLPIGQLDDLKLGALLVPLMTADAIVFAILSTTLGLLPWFTAKRRALITYLACAVMLFVVVTCAITAIPLSYVDLFDIPVFMVGVGLIWLGVISHRHFSRTGA